jgi:2-keto-myo-inositol isomerase
VDPCINGATSMPYPLEEDLEAAATAGFRHVEIWAGKLPPFLARHGLAGLRRALAERGLAVAALCPYGLRLFGRWEEGLEAVRRGVEVAAAVGAPVLLVCPDAPEGAEAGPDAYARAGERARAYAEVAAGAGVTLAVEPLGGHPFVPGPAEALRLLEAAGHPALALMLDTFHYHKSRVPAEAVARVPGHLWRMVHVNDCPAGDPSALQDRDRLWPGEGVLPLVATLRTLAQAGYRGVASVEVFRPAYWELPPEEIARRAYRAAAAVLAEVGA